MRFLVLIGIGTVCLAISSNATKSVRHEEETSETSETGRSARSLRRRAANATETSQQRELAYAAVTRGAWNFAINLYKNIGDRTRGSFVSSPLSVSLALTMAIFGAREKTRADLLRVLGLLDAPPGTVTTGYKYLVNRITNDEECTLFVANNVEPTMNGARPRGRFFERTAEGVRATQRSMDPPCNQSEPTRFVQRWISAQRSVYDCDIIGLGEITFDPMLVLSSALYFAGGWERPFDAGSTEMRDFWYDGAVNVPIPTMYARRVYRCGQLPRLRSRFVQLPYQGSSDQTSVSMFIVLPDKKDGLAYLEDNLEKLSVEKLYQGNFQILDLYLPKFTIENHLWLDETLQTMGLTDMFAKSANFSDISKVVNFVGNGISHAAVIETSNTGTNLGMSLEHVLPSRYVDQPETEGFGKITNDPVRFEADHPFIALVVSRQSGIARKHHIALLSARFTGH